MRRRLFTILCVFSLALWLVSAAAWVRSYWCLDSVQYVSPEGMYVVRSGAGRIVAFHDNIGIAPSAWRYGSVRLRSDFSWRRLYRPTRWWNHLGFGYWFSPIFGASTLPSRPNVRIPAFPQDRTVMVPSWFVTALLAALPTAWLLGFIRRRRRPIPGHCRQCGYNLTGNVSGVCPECGTAIIDPSDTAAPGRFT